VTVTAVPDRRGSGTAVSQPSQASRRKPAVASQPSQASRRKPAVASQPSQARRRKPVAARSATLKVLSTVVIGTARQKT
jgi:hypothetical protein